MDWFAIRSVVLIASYGSSSYAADIGLVCGAPRGSPSTNSQIERERIRIYIYIYIERERGER